jgi:DNA-binding NarL/FixJ family response regulator
MKDGDSPLEAEVRRLAHLVAVIGTDGKPQRDQIRILAAAGFPPKGIAKLIGTTGNTVKVALANMRKKLRARTRNKK